MLTKVCARCGIRYSGRVCPACEAKRQKSYDSAQRSRQRAALYRSAVWQRLTRWCRESCCGVDLYALYTSGRIVQGRLSHHIVPLEDNAARGYDPGNLIWVSDHSHAMIHRAYDASQEEKKRMQKMLFDIRERGLKGWGGQKSMDYPDPDRAPSFLLQKCPK